MEFDPEEEALLRVVKDQTKTTVYAIQFNLKKIKSTAKIIAIPRAYKHLTGQKILFTVLINN